MVHFYDHVDDSLLKFAVIIAKHKDKWIFCKHKQRIPGNFLVVTENRVSVLIRLQSGNFMKKPVQ